MKPDLLYIRKIEYCEAYHLRRVVILPAQAKALVQEPMPWQEIPIVGLAKLESSEEVENGTRIITSKLTATIACQIQLPTSPLSFRITDVRGKTYLFGTSNAPHPLPTFSSQIAENPSGEANHALSLQYKSSLVLLEIVS